MEGGHGRDDADVFASVYPALRRFAGAVRPMGSEADDLVQEALARTLAVRSLSELERFAETGEPRGAVAVFDAAAFDPRQTSDGSNDRLAPRQASVYDPASRRWTRLASAPFACTNLVDPVWAEQVLIYCPSGRAGGLMYIAGS
jgi:hypothetical protein